MACPLRAIKIVALFGAAAITLLAVFATVQNPVLAAEEPGVDEPDEMLVEPFPATVLTERERMLGQALDNSEDTVRLSVLN